MNRERRSLSLDLARGWYAIVGGGGLLLTAGHAWGALTAGSRFDAPLVLAGVAVGVLALAAAAWVTATAGWRSMIAWAGILAAYVPFAVAMWIAVTSAGADAQALVGIPTLITLVAGLRLGIFRSRSAEHER